MVESGRETSAWGIMKKEKRKEKSWVERKDSGGFVLHSLYSMLTLLKKRYRREEAFPACRDRIIRRCREPYKQLRLGATSQLWMICR